MSHFKKSFFIFLFLYFLPCQLKAYTLKELIELANKKHPLLQQLRFNVSSQKEKFKASYDPYYPSLDFSLGYTNYIQSRLNPQLNDKNYYNGSITLSYTLFDQKRSSTKEIKRYTFLIEENTYKSYEKDITKLIKDLYYKILVEKKKLSERKEALNAAKRSLDLAIAKKDVGIAKLSEVYQANVRYENAKLAVIESQNNLKKVLYELESIIDIPLRENDIEGTIEPAYIPFSEQDIVNIAIERREELQREKLVLKSIEEEKTITKAQFYPTAQAFVSYHRNDSSFVPPPSKEETRLELTINWNLFSGMGKYHNIRATEYSSEAQKKKIEELIRTIKLEVKKTYADFQTATEQIKVSEALVKSAKQNYEQAFEEYRIGKGDILSLIQSEIDYANAKDNYLNSILNQNLSKNLLERVIGITNFEDLK
jgi:outer membrane protein